MAFEEDLLSGSVMGFHVAEDAFEPLIYGVLQFVEMVIYLDLVLDLPAAHFQYLLEQVGFVGVEVAHFNKGRPCLVKTRGFDRRQPQPAAPEIINCNFGFSTLAVSLERKRSGKRVGGRRWALGAQHERVLERKPHLCGDACERGSSGTLQCAS